MKVAERQTTMNGVQGAYIMHALQDYLQDEKPENDGKAYAFTATLVVTYLRLYAHHLIAPTQRGKQPGCYATLLKAYALDDEEAYLTGRTAFRNLRMRAKEDRDRFIASANARARRQNTADEDIDEDIDDGSTERGDNFNRAGEEQQDQGSSPLNFYDAHAFLEPGRDTQDAAQDATQETQNTTQDSQLKDAGVVLDYNTDDAEIGIEGTSSFTSVSYEDYRRPRRQIKRVRSPLASSSTRQTPRNAASSSSTRKRARSPPSPPVTRQRKRRLESAG